MTYNTHLCVCVTESHTSCHAYKRAWFVSDVKETHVCHRNQITITFNTAQPCGAAPLVCVLSQISVRLSFLDFSGAARE